MIHFLALTLLMNINKKPSILHYWSTNPLVASIFFKSLMPWDRYPLILSFLNFADNKCYDPLYPQHDRSYKIRQSMVYLIANFQETYTPSEFISIGKELLLHKGKLKFKQYIPSRRARFGIAFFSLCEGLGYLWNSGIYIGEEISDTVCISHDLIKSV